MTGVGHDGSRGMEGVRAGAGQGLAQGATTILDRFLNRLPTITIRAGHRLRIWLTSDVLVPRPGETGPASDAGPYRPSGRSGPADGGGARGRACGGTAPGAAGTRLPGPVRGARAAPGHGARLRPQLPRSVRRPSRDESGGHRHPRSDARRAAWRRGAVRDAGAWRRRWHGHGDRADGRRGPAGRRADERPGPAPDGPRRRGHAERLGLLAQPGDAPGRHPLVLEPGRAVALSPGAMARCRWAATSGRRCSGPTTRRGRW